MRTRCGLFVLVGLVCAGFLSLSSASGGLLPRAAVRSTAIAVAPAFTAAQLDAAPTGDWITNGGSISNDRYSALNQVNTSNVSGLKLAWQTTLNGSGAGPLYSQEATPLVYQGIMYISTGNDDVFALDATTGQHLWEYQSGLPAKLITSACCGLDSRGVAIGGGAVYVAQVDGAVVAIDQLMGGVLWKTWNERWQEGGTETMAPLYYDGKVIVGMSGGELGARGSETAYDATTGEMVWRFFTCPTPGDVGGGTWSGMEWMHCGASIWNTPSVDPSLGLLYFTTGNPDPWSARGPGDDLFSDSFVALDANTGQLRWWFQTVHHDLWDQDQPSPTVLFDVTINGQVRHAIAEPGKTGWVYILDRTNGQPLLGIPEKKVPQLKSQFTSPTQPEPIGDTFAQQCAHKANYVSKKTGKILNAPNGKPYKIACIFTPYGYNQYVAVAPGGSGGDNWPPSSFNPSTSLLYVCSINGDNALESIPDAKQPPWAGGQTYIGDNFGVGNTTFANASWTGLTGDFTAMDMTTNKRAWQIQMPKGDCYSGSFTTAGGLVFLGHNNDSTPTYSAYDAATGKDLWDYPTNNTPRVGINAPGMTYMVNGKQYVSVFAGGGGGHSGNGALSGHGDIVYTFALG